VTALARAYLRLDIAFENGYEPCTVSLEIFKNRRSGIITNIADILRSAETRFGRPDRGSLVASLAAAELSKAIRDATQKPWLTDELLGNFLADEIVAALISAARPPGISAKLIAYAPFSDADAAAESLLTKLASLPWNYELIAATALVGSPADQELSLTSPFRLVRFAETTTTEYPIEPADVVDAEAFNRQYPERIEPGRYFFSATLEGYISFAEPAAEAARFIDAMIGLFGLMVCDGSVARNSFTYGGLPPALPVMIYRADTSRKLVGYYWLSHEQTAALQRLRHSERFRGDTLEDAVGGIIGAFGHIATRSAARWYLDSFEGSNGLMKVVQATIALEILLGDQKQSRQLGLTALLANRLAYLIGHSPAERERILSHFRKLYDIRSDIVHAGITTLGRAEQAALNDLQNYARSAINAQVVQLRTYGRTMG
jgi:hypothetical protein